jgi:hypothetical protein
VARDLVAAYASRMRWIVPALIVAALAAVGVAGALAGRHDDRDAIWIGLAGDARRGVDNSHLRLEELLAGDRRLRLENDVVNPLRVTEQICRALRDGGRVGIHDVDALERAAPARLCVAVTALREATFARAKRGLSEPPHGPLAAVHEQRFEDAVAALHSLDVAMQTAVRDDSRPAVIACAVAALLLLLALVVAVVAARRGQ